MCSNTRGSRLCPEGHRFEHQEEGAWRAGPAYQKTRRAGWPWKIAESPGGRPFQVAMGKAEEDAEEEDAEEEEEWNVVKVQDEKQVRGHRARAQSLSQNRC
jgi:hypothetical protein